MTLTAAVLGCGGPRLTAAERAVFAAARPWGFILFGRNVETPAQVRGLAADLRDAVGRDAPILVDQEGGRVQRLGPPHWRRFPPAAAYGALPPEVGLEAAGLGGRLIASDLAEAGLDVACLPVLDLPAPGSSAVIGDRAYAGSPVRAAALGRAVAQGLLAGGALPVMKHLPGHGRAAVDSHHALPVVDAGLEDLDARDFAPFRALNDLPLAMTAHVVLSALDPVRPATLSPDVIRTVIRGAIGFDGLLLSDDLSMDALDGDLGRRAESARAAGCDIALYGGGDLEAGRAVAQCAGVLEGEGLRRADAALARRRKPVEPFDAAEARARFDALFGGAWAS